MTADYDVNGIQLETQRLILRPLAESDFVFYCELMNLPEVAEFSGYNRTKDVQENRNCFMGAINSKECLVIIYKETNTCVGTISLQERNWPIYPIEKGFRGREFGFDVHPEYWGRGIMPEAVCAVMDYCFQKLDFDFITAGYFHGNTSSARVLEKCGFMYLFDYPLTFSPERTVKVSTFIRYNPYKEKSSCLN